MTQLKERRQAPERVEAPGRRNRNVVGLVATVFVLCAVSVGVILLNGSGGAESVPYVGVSPSQRAAIAGYADAEGLTGLSPASLTAVENITRAGVNPTTSAEQLALLTRHASQQGMTGLSPASLTMPVPTLSSWAQSEGLTGLSPASLGEVVPSLEAWARGEGLLGLSPASVSIAPISDLAAIAQWAEERGLTGLSPASLGSPEG